MKIHEVLGHKSVAAARKALGDGAYDRIESLAKQASSKDSDGIKGMRQAIMNERDAVVSQATAELRVLKRVYDARCGEEAARAKIDRMSPAERAEMARLLEEESG